MKQFFGALASLIAGEGVLRAVNVVTSIYIARLYGSVVLGAYAACIALITATIMFADNGVQTFAVTELSEETPERGAIATRLYATKSVFTALALVLLAAMALLLKLTAFMWMLGSLVALRIVLQSYSQLQIAFLKALRKASSTGGIQAAHALFLIAGIVLAGIRAWPLFDLLAWLVAGQVVECVLTWAAVRQAGLRPNFPAKFHVWSIARRSAPLGIVYGFANLIVRLDVVVLSWLVPLSLLGTFSAANSILLVFYLVAWLFGSLLLPEMLHLSATPRELGPFVGKVARGIWMAGLPTVFVGYLLAPKFITLLYGPSFAQSGSLASLMLLAVPFIVMNAVYTNWAIASQRKARVVALYAATAASTVVLDFIAGWKFGTTGVAAAIVLREAGMFFGFWCFMFRKQFYADEREYPSRFLRKKQVIPEKN